MQKHKVKVLMQQIEVGNPTEASFVNQVRGRSHMDPKYSKAEWLVNFVIIRLRSLGFRFSFSGHQSLRRRWSQP